MVAAFRVKSFAGGCVESVVTFATQRFFFVLAMSPLSKAQTLRCTGAEIVAA